MKRHIPVKGRKGLYWSENKTGKVYEVRFTDKGRSHFKVVGPNLKEAIAVQAEINVKLGKGHRVTYPAMSFGSVAEEWRKARLARLSTGTARKYEGALDRYLIPEFGTRQIRSITTDQIASYLHRLRTKDGKAMSGSYAQGIYMVLHSVMDYAANSRRQYIPSNPCASLETGERPAVGKAVHRTLTQDEAKALVANSSEWFRPIVLTALYTGMRASEILGLRWEDIDFDSNTIHVRWQLTSKGEYVETKGREKRDIDLLPLLRPHLISLPTRFGGEHVFAGAMGRRARYDAVQREFQAARQKAGIPDGDKALTMHACRHTFASVLLRDGKDVTWVSSILGHKSPTITLETYAHVMQRDNRTEEATLRLAEALGDLG